MDTDSDTYMDSDANPMAPLYCAEHVHIMRTHIPIRTKIPNHNGTHFWDGYPYPD